ncbi:MAG: DNA gyrase C-terminal beta-propeller domain-containing protein, partial [Streptococcus sp.]|nr:DNA gyrase C-terminal beta-propeller domain-containing protein [Streptococcus sp.]
TNVASISQTGRATLGVKIMKLDQDAKLMTFALVEPEEEEEKTGEDLE